MVYTSLYLRSPIPYPTNVTRSTAKESTDASFAFACALWFLSFDRPFHWTLALILPRHTNSLHFIGYKFRFLSSSYLQFGHD